MPDTPSRACPTDHREDPPRQGQPVWCTWCAKSIRDNLNALPELFARLYVELIPRQSGVESDRVGGSKQRQTPAPIIDDMDEILRWLWAWEDLTRAEFSLSHRPGGSADGTDQWRTSDIPRCVKFLDAWLERILSVPYLAQDFGDEVRRTKRQIEVRTKSDQLRHILVGVRCPSCDAMALARDDGDAFVCCMPRMGGCGRLWEEPEVRRLVVVLAAEAKRATA